MRSPNKAVLLATTALFTMVNSPAGAQNAEETINELEEFDTIVVTGSRIAKKSLTSNSPITTIDGSKFNVSAQTNIVSELQAMPAFVPSRSPTSGDNSGFTGSFLDLRGLGRGRTLTLVNGRRWLNSISDGGVDVSTIPPELVSRVDVVTGGASATYGSDAVAGVVNIMLRDDFDGLEFSSQTGLTDRGESTNYRFALTGGGSFNEDKGHATFHMSYDKSIELEAANRRFLNPEVTNIGGRLVPDSFALYPSATFFLDEDGRSGAFFGADGELIDADGNFNLIPENALNNGGASSRLQGPAEKIQVYAKLDYELSERVKVYMEGTFIHEKIGVETEPELRVLEFDIPINNPFIGPNTRAFLADFDEDGDGFFQVPLGREFAELGELTESNNRDSFRVMAGFEVDLGEGWIVDTNAVYSQSNFSIGFNNYSDNSRLAAGLNVVDGPNGPQCAVETVNGQICVPVNIFAEGGISAEAADFIRSNGIFAGNNTDLTVTSAVTGELFDLPAGPVGVAFGLEYRKNTASETPDDVLIRANGVMPRLAPFEVSLVQKEAFAEAIVPLIEGESFFEYLGLELGARYTDFSTGANAWTIKALAEWAPIEQVRIRGGIQRATRAPNAFELGGGDSDVGFYNGIDDPCFTGEALTGDRRTSCIANGVPAAIVDAGTFAPELATLRFTFFGNPDLEPEKAKTFTIGAVIQDLPIEGLNFTVDYFDIKLNNVVTYVSDGFIFEQCYDNGTSGTNFLCDKVGRDPVSGLITVLDGGPINAGSRRVSGIDFGANYGLDFEAFDKNNRLDFNLVVSRLIKHTLTPIAERPDEVDSCAGFYGPVCQTPLAKWKASFDVAWTHGPLTTALTWTWIGKSTDDAVLYDPEFLPELARTSIPATSYVDLNAVWEMNDKLELRAGIENLLDQKPTIVGNDRAGGNFFQGMYDAIGRRFFAGIRVKM